MQHTPWRIDGRVARLETEQLRAEIDLLNPGAGTRILAVGSATLDDATLFRVGVPRLSPSPLPRESQPAVSPELVQGSNGGNVDSAVDFFSRGNDLVATYSERPEHPFRAQIYWRALPSPVVDDSDDVSQKLAGIELIVSIQTSLLDSDPALTVESTIAAEAAQQLFNPDEGRFVDLPASIVATLLGSRSGAGCFVFCLRDRPLRYTEMVHPADFHHTTLERIAPESGSIRLAHRLFARRLEKGVILRSRICGIFSSQETDLARINRAYRAFASSDPPLTA